MQSQPTEYDFIMNPGSNKPGKRPLLPAGNSMKQRIMVVAGGAIILLIIVFVVIALFSSAGNAGKAELTKAAQQQAEIIRISKLGIDKAHASPAKNLATTTNVSMQSDQVILLAALKKQGIKLSPAELAGGKNAKTDATLTAAEQANRFDESFIQTTQTLLAEYQKALKTAFDSSSDAALKEVLSTQFENAGLLATAKQ